MAIKFLSEVNKKYRAMMFNVVDQNNQSKLLCYEALCQLYGMEAAMTVWYSLRSYCNIQTNRGALTHCEIQGMVSGKAFDESKMDKVPDMKEFVKEQASKAKENVLELIQEKKQVVEDVTPIQPEPKVEEQPVKVEEQPGDDMDDLMKDI